MERVTFLIERTGDRISCLLNPESLEARRTAGLARRRMATGGVLGNPRSDDPLIPTGGGITEYDLQLLFDVDLANEGRVQRQPPPSALPPVSELPEASDAPTGPEPVTGPDAPVDSETPSDPPEPQAEPESAVALTDGEEAAAGPEPEPPADAAPSTEPALPAIFNPPAQAPGLVADVRELTQPLWSLAETGAPIDGALVPPRVRFIWGKSWNVPGVVLAVAERLERFDVDGVPRRSWLSLRLRRVEDDPDESGALPPSSVSTPQFQLDRPIGSEDSYGNETMPVPVGPDGLPLVRADVIAAAIYGDPAMQREIYIASDIDNPHDLAEGQRYRLPPKDRRARRAARQGASQWA
jgi:hypothetical protein